MDSQLEKQSDKKPIDYASQLDALFGPMPFFERFYKLLEQARKELKDEGWSSPTNNLYKNKQENSSIAHDMTS